MFQIEGQSIHEQEFLFSSGQVNHLGPELEFIDFELGFNLLSDELVMNQVRFEGCRLSFQRPLFDFRWASTNLSNCKFFGNLVRNDFGTRIRRIEWGKCIECDFSDAILDGCSFFNVDMNRIQLPAWPCFTVRSPMDHLPELLSSRYLIL